MVSLENPTQQRQTEEIENNKASTSKPSISSTSVHDNSSSCSLFKSFFSPTGNSIEASTLISFCSSRALFSPSRPVSSLLFSSVLVSRFSDCKNRARTRRQLPSISAFYSPRSLYIFLLFDRFFFLLSRKINLSFMILYRFEFIVPTRQGRNSHPDERKARRRNRTSSTFSRASLTRAVKQKNRGNLVRASEKKKKRREKKAQETRTALIVLS